MVATLEVTVHKLVILLMYWKPLLQQKVEKVEILINKLARGCREMDQ
jgi:hypothetical protein